MQFLGTLFIIFFIFWLIGKALSAFWPRIAMWLIKRQVRSQMNQAFGQNGQQQGRQQREYDPFGHFRRKSQSYSGKKRRSGKIIDPSVGEYVEFEEIKITATEPRPPHPPIKPESQIEDADWEEIK